MSKYRVAVILINYNSAGFTRACIQSINEYVSGGLEYQIIIVDNNSSEKDYAELVNTIIPSEHMQLIRSEINLGFSGGNMLGVKYADAEYLFFLNNDTELLNDCPSLLYNFMKENPLAGLCTGQMYNTDKSFHPSFNYFPTLAFKLLGSSLLRLLKPSSYPDKKKEYPDPLKVDFVTGAAMFVRYSCFVEIGGFDTAYFLYCEEEDIAMNLKKAGYSTFLVPEAKFIHHMGKSTRRNLAIEKEHCISLLYYYRKHSNFIQYQLLKTLFFLKKLKKFYKHPDYLRLAIFILRGADQKHSMKYEQ